MREMSAGCYDGPYVKLSCPTCAEPAAAAMENVKEDDVESIINAVVQKILAEKGASVDLSNIGVKAVNCACGDDKRADADRIRNILDATPCFGNDIDEVDMCARKATQIYSYEVEKYKNPRGGQYQAGCTRYLPTYYLVKTYRLFQMDVAATSPLADGISPRQGHER